MLVGLSVFSCIVYLLMRKKRNLKLEIEQIGMLIFSVCLCVVLLVLLFGREYEDGFKTHRIVALSVCLAVVLVGGPIGRLFLTNFFDRKQELNHPTVAQTARMIFELCLSAIVITMAIKSRRFIPLGIIVIAPMIAIQIQWQIRIFGRSLVIIPLVVALLIPGALESCRLYRYYHPKNPFLPPSSLFQRMIDTRQFPLGAAEFINANNIDGRVFNEWRWEGFLKWKSPQLKPFIGGRAQQIYDIETYRLRKHIIDKLDLSALSDAKIHLAILPSIMEYSKLIATMVDGADAHWAFIYANEHYFVLADTNSPSTKKLIEKAAQGELIYSDSGIAALSRAMCLGTYAVPATTKQVAEAFVKANTIRPSLLGYTMLGLMSSQNFISPKKLITYLERENIRLEGMLTTFADSNNNLNCRGFISDTLSSLYRRINDKNNAMRWAIVAKGIRKQIKVIDARWK